MGIEYDRKKAEKTAEYILENHKIKTAVFLQNKYNIPIILQPKMEGNTIKVSHEKIMETFNCFSKNYHNTRLIGQVHKFFDIR